MAWAISGAYASRLIRDHAGGDLHGKLRGYLLRVFTQGHLPFEVPVIGVAGRDVPDRGLGLGGDEPGKVIDTVRCLGGVLDPPDDDRRDLDGVAVGVVDLGDGRLVVADSGGDPEPGRVRVNPVQAVGPYRPVVAAKQLDHAGLAGRDRGETARHAEGDREKHDAQYHLRLSRPGDPGDEQRYACGPEQGRQASHRPPGHTRGGLLGRAGRWRDRCPPDRLGVGHSPPPQLLARQ
jgi:hypothetical protein